jgi:cell division protein FtsI (penicillin-binding protein 3)
MAETPTPDAWRATLRRRVLCILVAFVAWTAGIEYRLVYLQVYRHDEYVAKARRQQVRTRTLAAIRGDIVDRQNRVLATSADVESVYAVPTEIDEKDTKRTATALCHALKDCTPEFLATLTNRLSNEEREFQFVKRHVSPEEAAAVRALKLDGVGFMSESHRFYPNRDLLGPVLGYVGLDNNGLAGIEKRFEETIRGKDGKVIVVTDAKRHAFDRLERPPTAGASIELTIDSVLQHDVERELARGVVENRAEDGVAVVMDPWTGEILAMASYPDYNPNIAGRLDPDALHNPAVEEIYEPGSTFKTVTASAALEEKLVTENTLIDCAPGYIYIGPRRVSDTHPHGVLTFTDVIVQSSNVGAIKTGFKVGADRLEQYVRRFGFGTASLPDLPAESRGRVWSQLTDDALASVSMGYQIGVTPVQMAAAVSSIANGGVLMRPRLVRATIRDGVRQPIAPEAIRRTVSAETAATLTTIMEGVVERGTGKTAQIDGYTIAGKTGTAGKVINGKYSKEKYFSSFVAFMPSRKPVITVVVMINAPSAGPYYGGLVAGPVFKRIAEIATRRLGIPRTVNPEQPVVVMPPAALGTTRTVSYVRPSSGPAAAGQEGVMPDLRGLSARAAVRTLARVGLVPRLAGSGFVTAQQPDAGSPLRGDEAVTLKLAREVDVPAGDSARQ